MEENQTYYQRHKEELRSRYLAQFGGIRKNRSLAGMSQEWRDEDRRAYHRNYYHECKVLGKKKKDEPGWVKRGSD